MLSWFMTLNGTIIIMALYLTSKGQIIKPPVIITEGFLLPLKEVKKKTAAKQNTINGRNHYEKRNQ